MKAKNKSTPAGGGANITGSAPLEPRVAGSVMTADLSPEGCAVVEQPTPDESPAAACSNGVAFNQEKNRYIVATNFQSFDNHQAAMAAAMRAASEAGRKATVFESTLASAEARQGRRLEAIVRTATVDAKKGRKNEQTRMGNRPY